MVIGELMVVGELKDWHATRMGPAWPAWKGVTTTEGQDCGDRWP